MINQDKNQPGCTLSASSTLLTSAIVVILAFLYIFSRIGLQESHLYFVYIFSGLSLLILNLPYWIHRWILVRRKELSEAWFLNELLITFYLFVVLVLASYCAIPAIDFILATSGLALSCMTLISSFKTPDTPSAFSLLVVCIFSLWIGSVCWSGHFLSPLFVESIELTVLNESSLDPLFHMAIAHTIKTYGAVSNGLHLLSPIKYHILSHYLFARISDLSGVHIVYTYTIGFVVIFPALFVKFMLITTDSLRSFFNVTTAHVPFIIITIILGMTSILPIPLHNRLAERVMTGNNFQFISESYLLSILIVLIILNTLIKATIHERSFTYLLFIFLPISIALCTISKVSTGFVTGGVLGYLFFRLKGYKNVPMWGSAVLTCCVSVLAALFVFARDSTNGAFEWMHFFNHYVETRAITFILLFFFWTVLFCASVLLLYYIARKRSRADLSFNRLFISAEIVFVASMAGMIPVMMVEIAGGSGVFFIEVQRWISLVLVASILPLAISFFKKPALPMKILKISMLVIMLINTAYYSARALKHNLLVRAYYVQPESTEQISKMNFDTESLLGVLKIMRDPRLVDSLDARVTKRPIYTALKNLMKLSSEADENKAIYIEDYSVFSGQIPCYHYFYFIPAFSGFAAFQGIPQWCIAEGYFLEDRIEWPVYNEESYCRTLAENDFHTLYKFDLQKNSCVKISCGEMQ